MTLEDTGLMERVTRILGAVLREAGLTNQAVEKHLGWSSGTLSRLFAGERGLRVRQLLSILEVAGIPPSRFFSLVEEAALREGSLALRSAILQGLSAAPPVSDPTPLREIGDGELESRIERVVKRVLDSRNRADV